MASAFQILPKRLCVSAAKCYFGKASEQDGLLADFISRLPDREVKFFTGDWRGEREKKRNGIRTADRRCTSLHLCPRSDPLYARPARANSSLLKTNERQRRSAAAVNDG